MCIEPPLPLQMPVRRPKSSAIMPSHVDALGDAVAVAAVRRGDAVALAELRADADGHRLLAGVEVEEAGQASRRRPARRACPRRRGSCASAGRCPSAFRWRVASGPPTRCVGAPRCGCKGVRDAECGAREQGRATRHASRFPGELGQLRMAREECLVEAGVGVVAHLADAVVAEADAPRRCAGPSRRAGALFSQLRSRISTITRSSASYQSRHDVLVAPVGGAEPELAVARRRAAPPRGPAIRRRAAARPATQ